MRIIKFNFIQEAMYFLITRACRFKIIYNIHNVFALKIKIIVNCRVVLLKQKFVYMKVCLKFIGKLLVNSSCNFWMRLYGIWQSAVSLKKQPVSPCERRMSDSK